MSDEFEEDNIDKNKWFVGGTNGIFMYDWPGRTPSQFAPENVRVENGKFYLTTKWDPDYDFADELGPDCNCPYETYTTAAVRSKNKFKYGYMEIKCKAADVSITSSFWVTGDNSELDVFEFVADSKLIPYFDTLYKFCVGDALTSWCDNVVLSRRVGDDFHIYGCEWDSNGLKFYTGGGGSSISYTNNTWRLAAKAGFGWYGWNQGYLGHDMVIVGWDFFGSYDSPLFVGAPPDGHDFGIARDPEEFATIFEEYPDVQFIGINEFIGYLHSNNSGRLTKEGNLKLELTVQYDDHYCWHFKDHSSEWTFEISDWMAKEIGEELIVTVNGIKLPELKSSIEPFDIPIPSGIGEHWIKIESK